MALDSSQVVRQLTAFFRGLTARQRMMLASSVVVVAGLLYGFVILMGRSEYQVLYRGLSPSEGATLVQHLAVRGISAELSADGTDLSVPAGKAEGARLGLAAEGLPRSGHLGFEIFDKPNWAGSDFVEQVNYQRALEGELEKTIESMSSVEAVRVHLAMAHDALYTDQQRDSKAAVLVKLHPGVRLSDEDLNAIAFLVSNAVDNMKPEDVRVVDVDGHVPILSHRGEHSEQAQDLEAALSQKLVDTLSPLVGADQVRANVTVEYENGSNETTQESYDTNDSVVLTSQTNGDESLVAPAAQGVPGSSSNVPQAQSQQPPKPPAASEQLAGLHSDNKTFGVGKMIRHTVLPPGGIRRISAAVVVDDAIDTSVENGKKVQTRRKRTPDEIKELEALAAAAVGANTTRGDQVVVENLSFSATSSDKPTPPTLVQRMPSLITQWLPVLRYLGLAIAFALTYLLILKPLRKQLAATFREIPQLQAGAAAPALVGASAGSVQAAPGSPAQLQAGPPSSPIGALKETLSQRVTTEPVQTGRLVQDWLRQR